MPLYYHVIYDTGNSYTWDEYAKIDFKNALTDFLPAEIYAIFDTSTSPGSHQSKVSALYDDLTYYVDTVQESDIALKDDVQYFVCYYEQDCGSLTYHAKKLDKSQIIANIKAQKYIEGATYFEVEKALDHKALIEEATKEQEVVEAPSLTKPTQNYVAFGKDGDTYYVQLADSIRPKENIPTRNEAMLWAAVEGIRLGLEVKEW